MAPLLLLVVCVSNTCRSPMAEHLCALKLRQRGLDEEFRVESRSLSTEYEPEGSPASAQGVQVLREDYGIDMSAHRSRLLTERDVHEAAMIIPVKEALGRHIALEFPEAKAKLRLLESDISDPWRQPVPVFRTCARLTSDLLDTLLELPPFRATTHK